MDPDDAIKIFLSYVRKDGAELARRLHADLTARGFAPWLDKHRVGGGASWTEEIEQALDAAAFFLAVMTPGSYESEICRAEQVRALRKGKLVIPLLGHPIPIAARCTWKPRTTATSPPITPALSRSCSKTSPIGARWSRCLPSIVTRPITPCPRCR